MERIESYYSNYFVQSPESEFQSPTRPDSAPLVPSRINELSSYSDFSKKSENNFMYNEDDDEKTFIVPLRSSNSGCRIFLQILWRFLFSFGVALLVFYVTTQPPLPYISFRIGRINQFMLEEGVDSHGSLTKFLTCNCSTKLIVDNKSNFFGLHIHPPSVKLFFRPLNFAKAQGTKLYAVCHESTTFELYIGTRNRAMYGAGREMDDLLQSRAGLPLMLRMSVVSDFRVVWKFINPTYHHQFECLLFLAYSERSYKEVIMVREKCRLVS